MPITSPRINVPKIPGRAYIIFRILFGYLYGGSILISLRSL